MLLSLPRQPVDGTFDRYQSFNIFAESFGSIMFVLSLIAAVVSPFDG